MLNEDNKAQAIKERPPFYVDKKLIEAAKKAAEIFEKERIEYENSKE